jgi:L-ribulose-5-phosphate 3-epimerase
MKNANHALASLPLALVDWRLPVYGADAVRLCAEYKIHALQLDFGGPGRAPNLNGYGRQDAILEACDLHNVRIIAIAGNQLNDIGLGSQFNRRDRQMVENLIVSILDVAHYLAAPLVFFPSFHKGLIRDEASLARTADVLRWTCKEASDRNIIVGNENDLSINLAKKLFAEVNAENFRFIFDCYNLIKAGYSPIELLSKMSNCFARQVHIKDGSHNKDGYTALGQGDGQLPIMLHTLMQENWVEYYVLENDYRYCDLTRLSEDLNWISGYFSPQRYKSKQATH